MALFSSRVARSTGPLERLGKVVVLEDILDAKEVLEDPDVSREDALKQLRSLQKQYISYDTLKTTKIGIPVRLLGKRHTDPEVAALAKKLVRAACCACLSTTLFVLVLQYVPVLVWVRIAQKSYL